jgi:hypothetical protein
MKNGLKPGHTLHLMFIKRCVSCKILSKPSVSSRVCKNWLNFCIKLNRNMLLTNKQHSTFDKKR